MRCRHCRVVLASDSEVQRHVHKAIAGSPLTRVALYHKKHEELQKAMARDLVWCEMCEIL